MATSRRMVALGLVCIVLTAACSAAGSASSEESASPAPAATSAADRGTEAAGGATEVARATITFESYNYGTEGLGGEGTQLLLDEFAAAHEAVTVEPVGTPAGDIHTSVQAQVAAGDPPAIAQIGWSKYSFVLENLPYVPFEDFVPADEWEEHIAGIPDEVLAMGQHDGKTVGLPYTVSTPTLFVNADLFEEAGLDPASPPATWDEAEEAALAITEATDAEGIYVNAANDAKSDFITQSLINSNGGAVLTDDGEVAFDSPEAIAALEMLGDLTASGAQPAISEPEATQLFEAGRLGMYLTSTALLGGLISSTEGAFELTTAGMPAFGEQPVGPTNSGGGLFVFATEPAEQQAAWELARFLTSAKGFTIITEVIGYLPLRPEITDDPEYLGGFFADDQRLEPAIEQLENLVPYQVFPGENGTRARELLQDNAVAPIMLSGADAAEVVPEVADRVRELLAQ